MCVGLRSVYQFMLLKFHLVMLRARAFCDQVSNIKELSVKLKQLKFQNFEE